MCLLGVTALIAGITEYFCKDHTTGYQFDDSLHDVGAGGVAAQEPARCGDLVRLRPAAFVPPGLRLGR